MLSVTSSPQHHIFRVCLKCDFDSRTKGYVDKGGLIYQCPRCKEKAFMVSCEVCGFETREECPLGKLLFDGEAEKRDVKTEEPAAMNGLDDEEKERGRSRKRVVTFAETENNRGGKPGLGKDDKSHISSPKSKDERRTEPRRSKLENRHVSPYHLDEPEERNRDNKNTSQPSTSTKSTGEKKQQPQSSPSIKLSDLRYLNPFSSPEPPPAPPAFFAPTSTPPSPKPPSAPAAFFAPTSPPKLPTCDFCTHTLCNKCTPGWRSLVVDMREFSKDFGAQVRLCTLCEHGDCPRDLLSVKLRCGKCGHLACRACGEVAREVVAGVVNREEAAEDEQEKWCVCCKCSKREKGL